MSYKLYENSQTTCSVKITTTQRGFEVTPSEGAPYEVRIYDLTPFNLKYSNEVIAKILKKSSVKENVSLDESANSLILKICEMNQIFF